MASNRKTRLPSAKRDVLTGEPLVHTTVRICLPDRDKRRHPDHQTPIPFRLHTRAEERVERDGTEGDLSERLGCNEMSGQLIHYLDEGEKSAARQAREWWDMAYITDRLFAQAGEPPAPFTLDELQIALAWYRGGYRTAEGKRPFHIERACRRVRRFVRDQYLADAA